MLKSNLSGDEFCVRAVGGGINNTPRLPVADRAATITAITALRRGSPAFSTSQIADAAVAAACASGGPVGTRIN